MMNRLILLFLLVICLIDGYAIEITGQNKAYAGRQLQFFHFADPVTLEEVHAFTIDVDVNGNFHVKTSITNPTFVFCDFGIYRGNLILRPGNKIELLLPPYREKSFAQKKNPYYNPVEFWFAVKGGDQITDVISDFDNKLNKLTDQYFDQLYFERSIHFLDSIKKTLSVDFNNIKDEVFLIHQELSQKAIEVDVLRLTPAKVTPLLQETDPAYWNFPAYIQLFNKIFSGKLNFEAQSIQGKEILRAIAKMDLTFFRNFLQEKYGATDKFSDLVLIKLLHDGYYSGSFSRDHILSFISTSHFKNNPNPEIRSIAVRVYKKLIHLRTGTKAPVICLKDINGMNACTSEGTKLFKYFVFADTEMVVVREQLKYLSKIEELFGKHLDIYVVLLKTDLIEMKKFLIEENIPGVHLVDVNDEYIKEYRVRTFPACHLVDIDHTIIFQDTKAPLDGFEQQFGSYLQKFLFGQQK